MALRIKEKAINHRENDDKRPRATARYIRMSPRKVKAVIDLIRNKSQVKPKRFWRTPQSSN